jgi:hypothetical protein
MGKGPQKAADSSWIQCQNITTQLIDTKQLAPFIMTSFD